MNASIKIPHQGFIGSRGVKECELITFKLKFQDFICYKIPILLSSNYFRQLILSQFKNNKNPVIDLHEEDARSSYLLLSYLNFSSVL